MVSVSFFPNFGLQSSALSNILQKASLNCGMIFVQGRRAYMEDETLIFPELERVRQHIYDPAYNGPPIHLFGIFDGHAGGKCSKAICSTIPQAIAAHPRLLSDPMIALHESFERTVHLTICLTKYSEQRFFS